MSAKSVINETRAEVASFRTKNQQMERQIQKYEKIIEELHHSGRAVNSSTRSGGAESFLYVNLKK